MTESGRLLTVLGIGAVILVFFLGIDNQETNGEAQLRHLSNESRASYEPYKEAPSQVKSFELVGPDGGLTKLLCLIWIFVTVSFIRYIWNAFWGIWDNTGGMIALLAILWFILTFVGAWTYSCRESNADIKFKMEQKAEDEERQLRHEQYKKDFKAKYGYESVLD
jgi:Na+-transporting methylmalonyl-CoA/oxaloacetate decarboxylase gamma subunit